MRLRVRLERACITRQRLQDWIIHNHFLVSPQICKEACIHILLVAPAMLSFVGRRNSVMLGIGDVPSLHVWRNKAIIFITNREEEQ